jgi:hypothetical protein
MQHPCRRKRRRKEFARRKIEIGFHRHGACTQVERPHGKAKCTQLFTVNRWLLQYDVLLLTLWEAEDEGDMQDNFDQRCHRTQNVRVECWVEGLVDFVGGVGMRGVNVAWWT